MNQDIKELLELAAKACGYVVQEYCSNILLSGAWVYKKDSPLNSEGEPEIFRWKPHLDDGDGARMEAERNIEFRWHKNSVTAFAYAGSPNIDIEPDFVINERYADHNGNRQAARRMASLRVAAEIGRRME